MRIADFNMMNVVCLNEINLTLSSPFFHCLVSSPFLFYSSSASPNMIGSLQTWFFRLKTSETWTYVRMSTDNRSHVDGQPVASRRTTGRMAMDNRLHDCSPRLLSFYMLAGLELFYPLSPFHLFEHMFRNQPEQAVFHCVVAVGEREESVGSQPLCTFLGQ